MSRLGTLSLFALLTATACGDNHSHEGHDDAHGADASVPDPCDFEGNIEVTELPDHGSAAFVISNGEYQFFQRPGMEDSSISYVDANCEYAYGWSRDKPVSDPEARESSWRLHLATMTFEDIEIPGTTWAVLRASTDSGLLVGKAGIDSGTPEDPKDDESRAFIHNMETNETELISREGFSDIGFTAVRGTTYLGFNDFGTQGFVYADGAFTDLNHDDAFRLFPFQLNAEGTIVGFWGTTADTWYISAVNPAFIATPAEEGYAIEQFSIEGHSGTGLTGINDAGTLTGLSYATESSLPVVFRMDDANAEPEFFPLEGNLEPFPTGVSDAGFIYGQTFILSEPPPCGGHGTPDGDTCVCDEGYELDPLDMTNCLPPEAECDGHGHLHGSACHCDSGYMQDPDDEGSCIPA